MAFTLRAVALRVHVLVCTDCTARALGWCCVRFTLCPTANPARPDAPSLCHGSWTSTFQKDSLDIQPLQISGGGVIPSGHTSPYCIPSLLHCSRVLLYFIPSLCPLPFAPLSSGTCVMGQAGSSTLLIRAAPVHGAGQDPAPDPASAACKAMRVQQAG